MTVKGYNAKTFVAQTHISGQTSSFTVNLTVDNIQYSVLQNSNFLNLPSLPHSKFSLAGTINAFGATDIETTLRTALATEGYFSWLIPDGLNTGGSIKYFSSNFTIDTPVDNLIAVNCEGEKTDYSFLGNWILNQDTLSATGAQTGIDFSTAGTTGGKALLLVHSIVGTATNAQIKIQSDSASNFATAADEATVTFSAVGAFPADLSGTVNRYVRANVVSLGGATSFSVSLLCGLKGVNY